MDTWRTWELVLPLLERRHDVFAPTFPGHAGGPALEGDPSLSSLADAVEAAMDESGFATAHLVGNSLGGFVALQLAVRGRAESVVALAPAGGWAAGDDAWQELLAYQRSIQELVRGVAAHADTIVATSAGRRRATQMITSSFEHIPAELIAHQLLGVARCDAAPLIELAGRAGWQLDAERIACTVRVVWGTGDRLLEWPRAAARFRTDWLPHADWVELDGVGHCPQLDVPLETAQLVLWGGS